jgi:hypothetical protein
VGALPLPRFGDERHILQVPRLALSVCAVRVGSPERSRADRLGDLRRAISRKSSRRLACLDRSLGASVWCALRDSKPGVGHHLTLLGRAVGVDVARFDFGCADADSDRWHDARRRVSRRFTRGAPTLRVGDCGRSVYVGELCVGMGALLGNDLFVRHLRRFGLVRDRALRLRALRNRVRRRAPARFRHLVRHRPHAGLYDPDGLDFRAFCLHRMARRTPDRAERRHDRFGGAHGRWRRLFARGRAREDRRLRGAFALSAPPLGGKAPRRRRCRAPLRRGRTRR